MSYRDELSALQSKLDEAEAELDALRAENAALRRGIAPRIAESGTLGRVLGAPSRLRIERTLDGELPASAHRELARIAQRAIGVRGSVISLGNVLVVRTRARRDGRFVQVRITAKGGATHVVVEEDLGQAAGGIFGGIGGGVGFGGLGAIVPAVMLATSPWVAVVAAPLWLGLVYGFARVLFASIAERRKNAHVELVGELARVAQDALEPPREIARARVRIESETDDAPADGENERGAARVRPAMKRPS